MAQSRRLRLWFVLALIVALVTASALWLRGTLTDGSSHSPLPTSLASSVSPLPTPTPPSGAATPPSSWASAGAALLWVTLGAVLALGVVFLTLRRNRHDA